MSIGGVSQRKIEREGLRRDREMDSKAKTFPIKPISIPYMGQVAGWN